MPVDKEKEKKACERMTKKLGLTPEEVKKIQRAAGSTWGYVSSDLPIGKYSRAEVLELIFDAGRIEQHGFDQRNPITDKIKEVFKTATMKQLSVLVYPSFGFEYYE